MLAVRNYNTNILVYYIIDHISTLVLWQTLTPRVTSMVME